MWTFYFFKGRQQSSSKELDNCFVLPVPDVPEPSAIALPGIGLGARALAEGRRRKQQHSVK
jgi:hypothetical protein